MSQQQATNSGNTHKRKSTSVMSNDDMIDLNAREREKPLPTLKVFFTQQDNHDMDYEVVDDSLPSQISQQYIKTCLRKRIGAEVETDKVWFHYNGIVPKALRVDPGLFGKQRKAYCNTKSFDLTHKKQNVVIQKQRSPQATTTTTTTTTTTNSSDEDSDNDNAPAPVATTPAPVYDHVVLRPETGGVKRRKDKRYHINNCV